jgi:hypothetical protein
VIIFSSTNWEPIENLKGTCLVFDQKGCTQSALINFFF